MQGSEHEMLRRPGGAGEVAPGLRALAVLAGDQGLVPSSNMVAHNPSVTSVSEDPTPSSDLCKNCMHVVRRHTNWQNTPLQHIHTI